MNFFDATANDGRLEASAFSLPLPGKLRGSVRNGQRLRVGVRPENIRESEGRGETARVTANVDLVEPIGHEAIVHTSVNGIALVAAFDAHAMPRVGSTIELVLEIDALHVFDAESEMRI